MNIKREKHTFSFYWGYSWLQSTGTLRVRNGNTERTCEVNFNKICITVPTRWHWKCPRHCRRLPHLVNAPWKYGPQKQGSGEHRDSFQRAIVQIYASWRWQVTSLQMEQFINSLIVPWIVKRKLNITSHSMMCHRLSKGSTRNVKVSQETKPPYRYDDTRKHWIFINISDRGRNNDARNDFLQLGTLNSVRNGKCLVSERGIGVSSHMSKTLG